MCIRDRCPRPSQVPHRRPRRSRGREIHHVLRQRTSAHRRARVSNGDVDILEGCAERDLRQRLADACRHEWCVFSPYSALIPCLLYTSPSPRDS
eukprot:TRINITY_DN62601_c0_g1_i1.p2 TRINITY_DN62601_c0_g1~~TRINITY_DN62601_c0_g1_i1.p2  ORF type:complete len:108 (+),score=9.17 TRINITY_DN62601_c0_g1_i1:44-325(+)